MDIDTTTYEKLMSDVKELGLTKTLQNYLEGIVSTLPGQQLPNDRTVDSVVQEITYAVSSYMGVMAASGSTGEITPISEYIDQLLVGKEEAEQRSIICNMLCVLETGKRAYENKTNGDNTTEEQLQLIAREAYDYVSENTEAATLTEAREMLENSLEQNGYSVLFNQRTDELVKDGLTDNLVVNIATEQATDTTRAIEVIMEYGKAVQGKNPEVPSDVSPSVLAARVCATRDMIEVEQQRAIGQLTDEQAGVELSKITRAFITVISLGMTAATTTGVFLLGCSVIVAAQAVLITPLAIASSICAGIMILGGFVSAPEVYKGCKSLLKSVCSFVSSKWQKVKTTFIQTMYGGFNTHSSNRNMNKA